MSPRTQAPIRLTDAQRVLQGLGPLPEARSQQPLLVVTVGLPGSGKSTFCRRLCPAIEAVMLESDLLRRRLVGQPIFSAAESRRLFSALYAVARELLQQGLSVIIDATNLTETDRSPAYAIAALTSAQLLILHFTAPESVIVERLCNRSIAADPEDTSTAGIDVYRRLAKRSRPPLREHWRIDTADPEATESTFLRVIAAGRQATLAGVGGSS